MEDRLKFRAFDTFTEKMIQNHISICEGELYEWCPDGLNIKHDIGDSAIVMQCTGLKDKNGKLIYEGDIVKINDELFKVIYWRAEFTAESLNTDVKQTERQHFNWYNFCYPNNQSIIPEVIGNIYENPELLGGE